jgi:hypothetical protein
VIQDILPTNERLHKIRLVDSTLCGQPDTFQHSVTSCGDGASIWLWTKRRIAWIMSIDPVHITPDWTTRPHLRLWPPQGHRAVLWTLAQILWYRIKGSRACTEQDHDSLRRTRWKAYQPKYARPKSEAILRFYDREPTRAHRGVAASG